jgi:hypothetical protein
VGDGWGLGGAIRFRMAVEKMIRIQDRDISRLWAETLPQVENQRHLQNGLQGDRPDA